MRLEVAREPRGKDALQFIVGVGVIALGGYLTWNNFLPRFLADAGVSTAYGAHDGYGVTGVMSLALDTVFMAGWGGITFATLMWKFIKRVMNFSGTVVDLIQGETMTPAEVMEILADHEERLRILEPEPNVKLLTEDELSAEDLRALNAQLLDRVQELEERVKEDE